MTSSDLTFQTSALKSDADYLAPDGSEIRLLPTMKGGGLCHCTLPVGKTSSPVAHQNVEEIWYVIEGEGEVWRKVGRGRGNRPCERRDQPDDPPARRIPVSQYRSRPAVHSHRHHAAVARPPGGRRRNRGMAGRAAL